MAAVKKPHGPVTYTISKGADVMSVGWIATVAAVAFFALAVWCVVNL